MRSIREILDAQRFLQRYANGPIETISKEQALKNLKKLGILTDSGEIVPEYADIVCKQTEIEKRNRKWIRRSI